MITAFCVGPTAGGRGLCNIDRILFRVTKSRIKKTGKSLHDENYSSNRKRQVVGIFLSNKNFPIF